MWTKQDSRIEEVAREAGGLPIYWGVGNVVETPCIEAHTLQDGAVEMLVYPRGQGYGRECKTVYVPQE